MKTVYCDSGMTWCKQEVSNDYKTACEQLNSRGWKKVGFKRRWGWYCNIHACEYLPPSKIKGKDR